MYTRLAYNSKCCVEPTETRDKGYWMKRPTAQGNKRSRDQRIKGSRYKEKRGLIDQVNKGSRHKELKAQEIRKTRV